MARGQTEMEQPSNSPAARVSMRQSCDRCHSQKLRCTRPCGGDRGACNRCLRQGAQCVYSFSLPKGRPSMYRSSESRGSATRRSRSPRDEQLRPVIMAMPTPGSPDTPLMPNNTNASDTATIRPSDTLSPPNNNNSTQLDSNTLGPGGKGDAMSKLDTPWLNTMVDWEEIHQPDPNSLDAADLNGTVKYSLGPAEVLPDDFWSAMDWDSHVHQNETISQFPTPPPQSTPDYSRCAGGSDSSSLSHHRNTASDSITPECRVVQLSQLVARLQSQYRTSCDLMEKGGLVSNIGGVRRSGSNNSSSPNMGTLFDDRAYRSMASWLLQTPTLPDLGTGPTQREQVPPSLGDMLSSAFVGSHQLLDIVRGLSKVESHDTMPLPALRDASTTFHRETSATTPGSAGGYATTVTRHLVLACHNLLLSVYVLLLAALQHDAQLLHSSGATGDHSAALAEIRLVSIVQLCAYLIKQQEQATVAYVGDPSPSLESVLMTPSSTTADTAGGDRRATGNDPMAEVQERLAHLRTTLQFS
ncbi:hypothetical protein PG993_014900 [Apiospora rasikravindrae]|uniref:Zn(2)-C6 fungal-type domain-containing protein n=1 Tax=Apiospora rasikravindrae TaxID=990691 RepID=A0ABR1RP13_9PEZI